MQNKVSINVPTIRIINIQGADIFYHKFRNEAIHVEAHDDEEFDELFSDIVPPNLDLIYLKEKNKLKLYEFEGEFYSYDLINLSFFNSLYLNDNSEKTTNEKKYKEHFKRDYIRKDLYLNGFVLNKEEYVRYKRSSGSAKNGSCLFIKKSLYPLMQKWSKAGLDEKKDKCFESLTSYEAYKALSLSSVSEALILNPYNILFVKDAKVQLKNQEVVRVFIKDNCLNSEEKNSDIINNIFDGEGLLDREIFDNVGNHDKGMMLLRNRFFKCCAFNTNLHDWFEKNNITSIDQLNGITFAKDIKDIKLVVSESCLKYLKMCEGDVSFSAKNIKRWCDEISEEDQTSLFGVVKTDKPTRFFNGRMVETTYQLLNTLHLKEKTVRKLLYPNIQYIDYIRNIKEHPAFIRYYLEGENHEDYYKDDNENVSELEIANEILEETCYSYKKEICKSLITIDGRFKDTNLFKKYIFTDVINSLALKIYNGRVLVHGTYATLFGNPFEFLKYIIKDEKGHPLFDVNKPESLLKEKQIYCPFFENNAELIGSRAPHITIGNVLYSQNVYKKEFSKWFNLSKYIVVVDSINNNIQHRLNGCDFDSDALLLSDDNVLVETAKQHYDEFLVPYADVDSVNRKIENLSKDKKENIILNLYKIDSSIATNNVGAIVNLSQLFNSYLWDKYKKNSAHIKELYHIICSLSVLSGIEIDSAKRSFDISTSSELKRIKKLLKKYGLDARKPIFYSNISNSLNRRLMIGEIDRAFENKDYFKTSMDYIWKYTRETSITYTRSETIDAFDLFLEDFSTYGLSTSTYKQADKVIKRLEKIVQKRKEIGKVNREQFETVSRNLILSVKRAYKYLKININTPKKARFIIYRLKEKDNGLSLLYLFLYLVNTFSNDLGYRLNSLLPDGVVALPTLKETNNKEKANYILFNRFYYEMDVFERFFSAIFD